MKNKEKFVMTLPLLADSKGVKIGKSEGNVIGLTDSPAELFGKIMSLSDDTIVPCFTLLTDTPIEEIEKIKSKLSQGENPMPYKKQVAHLIVSQLHSQSEADSAQQHFEKTVQQGEVPTDIESAKVTSQDLVEVLVETGLVKSKSEARRLIEQKGVKINQQVASLDSKIASDDVLQVGSRRFLKIL